MVDYDFDVLINSEFEFIELVDFELLIGVDKMLLFNKLLNGEIVEEVFVFCKLKVLNYVE